MLFMVLVWNSTDWLHFFILIHGIIWVKQCVYEIRWHFDTNLHCKNFREACSRTTGITQQVTVSCTETFSITFCYIHWFNDIEHRFWLILRRETVLAFSNSSIFFSQFCHFPNPHRSVGSPLWSYTNYLRVKANCVSSVFHHLFNHCLCQKRICRRVFSTHWYICNHTDAHDRSVSPALTGDRFPESTANIVRSSIPELFLISHSNFLKMLPAIPNSIHATICNNMHVLINVVVT